MDKIHQQRLANASTQSPTAEPAFVSVVRVSSEQALVELESNPAISSPPETTSSTPTDRAASSTLTVLMPNGITLQGFRDQHSQQALRDPMISLARVTGTPASIRHSLAAAH